MIAKCVALLAVVAQINACACNSNYASGFGSRVISSGFGSAGVASSAVVAESGVSGSAITRNVVAKGKYPVALSNVGPAPGNAVPITTSHVQAPAQVKPTVRLASSIPAPKVVAHSCTCYKSILRPRVHNQYITVPTVQNYIETTHRPVVENIQYEAVPVNDPTIYGSGAVLAGQFGSSSAFQTSSLGTVGSVFQAAPVSSSFEVAQVAPVASAVQVAPVAASVQVAPVATSVQVAPVSAGLSLGSFSSGCNGIQASCY